MQYWVQYNDPTVWPFIKGLSYQTAMYLYNDQCQWSCVMMTIKNVVKLFKLLDQEPVIDSLLIYLNISCKSITLPCKM